MAERDISETEEREASGETDAGWAEGAVIPPVAYVGPSAGVPNLGLSSSMGAGSGIAAFPVPAVPVVEDHHVGEQKLANPFTPAEPRNDVPFSAEIPDASDLPSRVEAELAADGRMANANIVVTADDEGVVTLTGSVPSPQTAVDAAEVAARVPGVRAVMNGMTNSE